MIRRLRKGDIEVIRAFLEKTTIFKDEEVSVATEMMEDCVDEPEQGDYISYVAVKGESVVGWICFGKTDFCQGVYDMYWICVDREFQGKGIGRELVQFMEEYLKNRGDLRIIAIETSSQEKYLPTRRFYEGCGFALEASLDGFYAPGDNKLIYLKHF